MVISNKYKDISNDFIDSSDLKSLNWQDQFMKSHAIYSDLKAIERDYQKGVV